MDWLSDIASSYLIFARDVLEQRVVALHAVVEVDLYHLVGKMVHLLLVSDRLGELVGELLSALAQVGGLSPVGSVAIASSMTSICVRVAVLLREHVLGAQTR